MSHPANLVRVTNAPGYADFTGYRIPGFVYKAVDGRGDLTAVVIGEDIHIVPLRCVEKVVDDGVLPES